MTDETESARVWREACEQARNSCNADPRIQSLVDQIREIHCGKCREHKMSRAEAIKLVGDCFKESGYEKFDLGFSAAGGTVTPIITISNHIPSGGE